jgi:hypothetical protein
LTFPPISREIFTLGGRAAGENTTFQVAQGSWGTDATLAARGGWFGLRDDLGRISYAGWLHGPVLGLAYKF